MKFPKNLSDKLETRKQNNALRQLPSVASNIDFASNDYLGFAKSANIFNQTHQFLIDNDCQENGATGSRLLSGNHPLYELTENHIANFHQAESALIFNSGYDANVGFFSSVPQKGDFISFTSNNDDLPSWFTSDMSCHTSLKEKKEYEKFMWDILEEWGGIEIERRTFYPCSPYIRMDAKFWD